MGDRIKKHKTALAALAFLLITVPGALNAWLALGDRFNTGSIKMTINWRSWQDIYSVIFPILGLAVIIFGLWWTRPSSITKQVQQPDLSASIPPTLASQLRSPKNDAIQQLRILGRDYSALVISKGSAGWPVQYPIRAYNTRPISIELVGYTVNIFWGGVSVQVVKWDKPSSTTSNGMIQSPIWLGPDSFTPIPIWVPLAHIKNAVPDKSPSWGAKVELWFQGDTEIIRTNVDLANDNYVLPQAEWEALLQNAFPR